MFKYFSLVNSLFISTPILVEANGMEKGGDCMMGMGNFNMWGYGAIFIVLFWGLIIFGIAMLILWLAKINQNQNKFEEKSALDILKQRYAKGEIDGKEFAKIKKELN